MPAARPASGRGRLVFAHGCDREPRADLGPRLPAPGRDVRGDAALGGLEVQLVFYRGFNECKASKWLATAAAAAPRDARGLAASAARPRSRACSRHAHRRGASARQGQRAGLRRRRDGGKARRAAAGWPASSALLGVPVFVFHEGGDPVAGARLQGDRAADARRLLPASMRQRRAAARAARARSRPMPPAAGARSADYGKRAGGAALLLSRRLGDG